MSKIWRLAPKARAVEAREPSAVPEPSGARVGCATVVIPFLAVPAGAALWFGFAQANVGLVLFGLFQLLIVGFAVVGVVAASRDLLRRSREASTADAGVESDVLIEDEGANYDE